MSTHENEMGLDEVIGLIEAARKSNSKSLDLSELGLFTIPTAVTQLFHLEELNLSRNQIAAIPDALGQLRNLHQLDLSQNRITAIPDALGQLRNLHQLILHHNQIAAIPDVLGQLDYLERLDLNSNRISAIPDALGQLGNLQILDLSFNEIDAIPDLLVKLADLTHINLFQNRITAIPELPGRLEKLYGLFLGHNRITVIADSLAWLANLVCLELGNNQITAIPDAFGRLSNLEQLYLGGNQITNIPASLSWLAKLEKLHLDGNPLPEEVFAALKLGIPSFLRYLQSTASRKVHPRTVKLVLLGEPKSGKTTLLEALQGNPHPCDDSRKETIGVNVVTVEKTHPVDHRPMYLSTWDFAGQHIEHATHQFFLTENAIYLILWNARQGTESGRHDLWYWLELLKMRVREPKFLLVATHTEHTPPDLNLSEIEHSYPGCEGHFQVEFANLKGLDRLEERVLEIAADSPSLRAEWPPEWLRVRDEVRKIRREIPHMGPASFRDLMERNGVLDSQAQVDLAGQLHNLGEILYFQERDELSNLVILNPEWVTELIGLVVRSKEVRENGGILRKTALVNLWASAKLAQDVRDHLVRLMDRFDLTYSTGHESDIGIVVEALPFSAPDDRRQIELPEDQPRTEMIFRFPSLQRRLPPGIPTWGIARAHRFSKCKPWRDAAAFEDADTKSQALVLASDARKEVRLSVAADYPPFFFGVLESILRDTFKRYPGMQPERRLPCPCQPGCKETHLYEAVLNRRRGRESFISCGTSGKNVAIELLLSGARSRATDEGVHALQSEMRRLFTVQLRAQREQLENTSPSVFTLLPSQGFKQLDTWLESHAKDEELELTLYCEHDTGWHSTCNSVYRFRVDQKWFEALKKKWGNLVTVSKYVGPLAKVFGTTPLAGIGFAASAIGSLPEPAGPVILAVSHGLGEKGTPEFVDAETRHLLERLIAFLDTGRAATAEPKNGGLHREIVEDGRVLWLCPDHARQYRDRGGRAGSTLTP